ncbi:hypothetical protein [Streptomyces virginiae]|uniref:hypothetical protein n=1 Tax=Streptomyces virginiae TaxID=1961 RepID=UPI003680AFFD
MRRATPEDVMSYYELLESDRHDVVLTGTVKLEGVDGGTACAVANERDGYSMRQALEEVLRDAVDDVRRTAVRLSARVEQIDGTHSTQ